MENEMMVVADEVVQQATVEVNKVDESPEVRSDGEYTLSQVMKWLMPWVDKTKGHEVIGDWEMNLPTQMLVNLVHLWLTEEGQRKVDRVLHVYHPVDRAAMAYALLVFMITGERPELKKAVARRHFIVLRRMLQNDMVELTFAGHITYMLRRYGKRVQHTPSPS